MNVMTGFIMRVVQIVFFMSLAVPLASMASHDSLDRPLTVNIQGIPAHAGTGQLFIRAARLEDGVVSAAQHGLIQSSQVMDTPYAPLLITATFISSGRGVIYEGFAGVPTVSETDSVDIPMKPMDGASSDVPASGHYPQTPPSAGKAISFDPADFSASGPGTGPWLAHGLAEIAYTDLGQGSCHDTGSADSYILVVTGNPRDLAALEQELDLQTSPDVDPETAVHPNLIRPTHMMKGDLTISGSQVTVNLRIEDMDGNVVATSSKTGPVGSTSDVITSAASVLSQELCRKKKWEGTVTAEYHKSEYVPNVDPHKPGATFKTDMSLTCQFQDGQSSSCSISYTSSMTGNGASTLTEASGGSPIISASVANDKVYITIGVFNATGTYTATVEGFTLSDPTSVQLGPWHAQGPASGDSPSQSGTWREGDMTITWSISKK